NGDSSNPPITDGTALDIHWYDNTGGNTDYVECNGEAVKAAIQGVPSPLNGAATGIGTWTKGALDRSKALIEASRSDHGEALGDRYDLNLVLTDGAWSGQNGLNQPGAQDPVITASDLWDNQEVPTYVVAVSTGADLALADELAAA